MPTTATVPKQFPDADSGVPATASEEPDTVEYPEGRWTAPSVWHGHAVGQAASALHFLFRRRKEVLVAMELVVYYERGNNKASLQPDVQVVFGVGRKGNRHSFKVWEEGKAPDFVLEVLSPSLAENEVRHRAMEYAAIGVREYWRLDPSGSLAGRPLEGYTASEGRCGTVEAVGRTGRGWWLRSRVLGLDMRGGRDWGATVVIFRDPQTGELFDGRTGDTGRWGRIAENWASAAEERAQEEANLRRAAEERLQALEERLRSLSARAGPEASG